MTYHSTTHALRRPVRQSFRGFGLGTIGAVTGVPPNVSSAAVMALQRDLVTLNLLPASGVDGKIGPNTQAAVSAAIYSLSLPDSSMSIAPNGYVTVNAAALAAIDAAASAGSLPADNSGGGGSTTPDAKPPLPASTSASTPSATTTFFKSLVADVTSGGSQAPGTTAPITTPGAVTSAPSKTVMWALIGGGVLTVAALAAVVIVSKKKTATVAANRRRRMRRNGSAEAQELVLYITNDYDLYRQQAQPIIKNLAKKMLKAEDKRAGRGVYKYDHALAAKAWGYLAESGAKKYAKDVAGSGTWHQMFDVATRNEAAKDLADYYLEEVQDVAEAMLQDRIRRLGKNPLPRGYSKKTFGKVIGIERAHGKSRSQAAAIAYRSARSAAKKAHVRPSYLRSNGSSSYDYPADKLYQAGRKAAARDRGKGRMWWEMEEIARNAEGKKDPAWIDGYRDWFTDATGAGGVVSNGLRRNGGYELVYSTGGTGGPYQDIQSAKDRAQGMIEHSRERWIGIVPAAEITNLHQAQAPWVVHRDDEDRVYWEKGPTYLPFSYFRERMRANRRTG